MKPISKTMPANVPAKVAVWFPCGKYFARTIRREDASERWASWLADEETAYALNIQPTKHEKKDIAAYIKQFDQRSCVLLGIFERGTRLHVGIIRIDIDYDAKEAILNAIIGDRDHRNRGATAQSFVPILDYLFDKLKLERVKGSVLRRNQVTLDYLLKAGWQIEPLPKHHVKSAVDGSMLEVVSLSYTRVAFHAWKQSRVGQRILARLKQWAADRQTGS